jgi:hypothetical protein
VLSRALRNVAFERAVQFGSDRHAAGVAAFSLEEAGWESDVAANVAVVHYVADRECEDFGDPEAKEHLSSDEGAVAERKPAHVPEEDSLLV